MHLIHPLKDLARKFISLQDICKECILSNDLVRFFKESQEIAISCKILKDSFKVRARKAFFLNQDIQWDIFLDESEKFQTHFTIFDMLQSSNFISIEKYLIENHSEILEAHMSGEFKQIW